MNFETADKISDIINKLERIRREHGDLPVCSKDPDTSWRLQIDIVYRREKLEEELPYRVEIQSNYID